MDHISMKQVFDSSFRYRSLDGLVTQAQIPQLYTNKNNGVL